MAVISEPQAVNPGPLQSSVIDLGQEEIEEMRIWEMKLWPGGGRFPIFTGTDYQPTTAGTRAEAS